jgi:hypothetical protein
MVPNARQVSHTTAADQHGAVFLQIMVDARMYAVTSLPLVSRTRATFRNAEFGFFGVCVRTIRQTPRICGEPLISETRLCSSRQFSVF